METAHDELKSNTIIIGALSFIDPSARTLLTCASPDPWEIQSLGPPVISRKRRCVDSTLHLLLQTGGREWTRGDRGADLISSL